MYEKIIFGSFLDIRENAEWPRFWPTLYVKSLEGMLTLMCVHSCVNSTHQLTLNPVSAENRIVSNGVR